MKTKNIKILLVSAVALASFSSCDEMFEPALENNLGIDYMTKDASYAEGVLGNGYTRIPCRDFPFSEVATDDAVSNDAGNSYRRLTAGAWTSDNNPAERWRDCRSAIMYLNLFLSKADQVHWADDKIASQMYCNREKGEAYGLRAMYMYYLLQAHGGYDEQGNLLGVPIVTEPENSASNFNVPRNTFADCMKAIYDDCAKALELLPAKYTDITSEAQIPEACKSLGADVSRYNRVFGVKFNGRMDGSIVEAFRSKAALLAASPAYSDQSGTDYQQAADYAAQVLDRIGGVSGMDPTGWTWYCNKNEIEGLQNGSNPKEVLWRGEKSQSNTLESDNYPPSLYGKGRINPTQNFVDAFPAANGYPITDDKSKFNAATPYEGRDPRLAAYVVVNGSKVGVNNSVINTAADGTTKDALDKETGSSTRTGYYLRKLLRQDINLDPANKSQQYHYTPRIRFTEIFLNYAEAANEAFGPKGKGSHAYSAYDVIKAIRHRAGVGGTDDGYLEECAQSKEKMRELIRNERRIELCFEGFRFWDLRRWKADITSPATGMKITAGTGTIYVYTPVEVEPRSFKDYMLYGPIPYSETLKFSELKQNKGW